MTRSERSGLETYPELAGEGSFAFCSSGGADPAVARARGAVCPLPSTLVAGGGWGQGTSAPRGASVVAALRSFSFGEEQGKSRKQGQGLCHSLSFFVISSLLLGTEIQHRGGGDGEELERSSLPCSCSSGPHRSISPALEGLLLLG